MKIHSNLKYEQSYGHSFDNTTKLGAQRYSYLMMGHICTDMRPGALEGEYSPI